MTFSVAGRCERTGMFGVAVASSSPAVAARCAHARAGVGAVASQNVTDPRLGPAALDLLALGATAEETVAILARSSPHMVWRQLLVVDRDGGSAIHSGASALGVFGDARGEGVACGGNLLASADIPAIMVDAFSGSSGELGDRLVATMRAALDAGGEAGPIHSVGMRLVREVDWPVADLRIDWTEGCPITELEALWSLYAPQLDDYVTRALDPGAAPSYGVAGDE